MKIGEEKTVLTILNMILWLLDARCKVYLDQILN